MSPLDDGSRRPRRRSRRRPPEDDDDDAAAAAADDDDDDDREQERSLRQGKLRLSRSLVHRRPPLLRGDRDTGCRGRVLPGRAATEDTRGQPQRGAVRSRRHEEDGGHGTPGSDDARGIRRRGIGIRIVRPHSRGGGEGRFELPERHERAEQSRHASDTRVRGRKHEEEVFADAGVWGHDRMLRSHGE